MLNGDTLLYEEVKEQVQVLMDLSPNYTFFKDKFFRYVMVNKNFATFQKRPPEYFIGRTDEDFLENFELLDTFLKQDIEVLSKEGKIEFPVVEIPLESGEIRYFRITKDIIKNYLGYDKLIFCTAVDVTQIIENEKQKQEKDVFYKHLFNNNLDGIVLFDSTEYKNLDCNERVLEIFKCRREEFLNFEVTVNQPHFQPDGTKTTTFMEHNISEAKRLGKLRTTFHTLRFDFSPCVLDIHIYKFSEVHPDHVVIIFKDITEQYNMMEQVIEDKERFKNLFERNPSGVAIVDFDWNVISVNDSWVKLLGYTLEELKEKTIPGISHIDDMSLHNELKTKAINGEIDTYKLRKRYIKKDGNTLYGELTAGVVKDKKGRPSYLIGILSDITDMVNTQEELNSKNDHLQKIIEELNTLVYRTSHDLRSPITSVMGLTNLFELNGEDDPNNIYVNMMKNQLTKLDNVIKDIIEYHKISHNEPERLVVDFETIINDKFDQLRFLPNFDKINTTISIQKEVDYIGDRYLIGILFNNFISNAIKYTDFGKPHNYININIHIDSENALIRIADNGIGIEKEYVDRIFKMFFRATELSQGTGLGLYMVREIISKMNGQINVDSNYGQGTTFEIILPNKVQLV
ncbi:MAG: PAS domain S-box protein [Bacteroidota bacterium]|nr:PAS domain S-box protein [Bacteroidota bacterium]